MQQKEEGKLWSNSSFSIIKAKYTCLIHRVQTSLLGALGVGMLPLHAPTVLREERPEELGKGPNFLISI